MLKSIQKFAVAYILVYWYNYRVENFTKEIALCDTNIIHAYSQL